MRGRKRPLGIGSRNRPAGAQQVQGTCPSKPSTANSRRSCCKKNNREPASLKGAQAPIVERRFAEPHVEPPPRHAIGPTQPINAFFGGGKNRIGNAADPYGFLRQRSAPARLAGQSFPASDRILTDGEQEFVSGATPGAARRRQKRWLSWPSPGTDVDCHVRISGSVGSGRSDRSMTRYSRLCSCWLTKSRTGRSRSMAGTVRSPCSAASRCQVSRAADQQCWRS